jgi:PAS domain S-box-containing protein
MGIGHFGNPGLAMADRVFAARLGILAVALCALVLAALFAERRQQARELAESAARLQDVLKASGVTTFLWNVTNDSLQRSANAAQVLGFDPQTSYGSGDFLAQVHQEDRERLKALIRRLSPEHPTYNVTFRFACPDGRELWLEESAKAEFDGLDRIVVLKGLTLDITARKFYEEHKSVPVKA